MENVKKFFVWLFCLQPESDTITDPFRRLLLSMNVTAKSRFNASMRLRSKSAISFYTTTTLSLGLILIPLLQNSDIQLAFHSKALNMMQIFLAVAILVYSIINSKAGYDVRSEKLNMCGDRIKEISRELDSKLAAGENPDYKEYLDKYDEVVRDSENHTRPDYLQTKLQLKRYYKITGLKLGAYWSLFRIMQLRDAGVAVILISIELIFVSEMLGFTRFVAPRLTTPSIVAQSKPTS